MNKGTVNGSTQKKAMALSQERTVLTYSFIFLRLMVKDSNHWMKDRL